RTQVATRLHGRAKGRNPRDSASHQRRARVHSQVRERVPGATLPVRGRRQHRRPPLRPGRRGAGQRGGAAGMNTREPGHGVMHMIGNAHIDPVWLWGWSEGFHEVVASFRSALDRLDESDDFTFVSSSAVFYAWIERHDPEMFERIKARVAEGRWEIV